MVSVVEENLHATLQLDTRHAIVGKGRTHERSLRPFYWFVQTSSTVSPKGRDRKGFDARIQTSGPIPLHGWRARYERAPVSQSNNLAHATSTGACGNSESRAPGLTRRPAPCDRVVVGPVARRSSGPRPPAASPAHSRLMQVARALRRRRRGPYSDRSLPAHSRH